MEHLRQALESAVAGSVVHLGQAAEYRATSGGVESNTVQVDAVP